VRFVWFEGDTGACIHLPWGAAEGSGERREEHRKLWSLMKGVGGMGGGVGKKGGRAVLPQVWLMCVFNRGS
jgi:hypothetical protein